jgi:hypothetical protein
MKEAFENSKIEKDLIKKYPELEPKEKKVKEFAVSYMLR